MAYVAGLPGYLEVVYLFTCTNCRKEFQPSNQPNRTAAIKTARKEGWALSRAGERGHKQTNERRN
jgi:hypothetical protein